MTGQQPILTDEEAERELEEAEKEFINKQKEESEFQDDFQIRIYLSSFKKPERLGERIAF